MNCPSRHKEIRECWGRRLGALTALALPLVIYLLTLAPSITWAHDGGDGGDLISAAYTLGVPHPPGYPTYCLLGWLFARLPLRDVAWRLNLMSAVGATLAALGLYLAVWEGQQGRKGIRQHAVAAGLGAAWGLAFIPVFWSQALIAEVYAVNAAFVALVMWLALCVGRSGVSPVMLGLAWGLGLGIHLTGVALVPVVVWALAAGRRVRSFPSMLLRWLPGAVVGLCIYVYLPLRADQGAITWGDPTTLAGWWWVVSGALYRGYVFALPLEVVPARLLALARYLASGFGPTGIVMGVLGVDVMAHRQRGFLLATGLSWLLYVAYSIGYNTTDSYVYLIPALVISAFWLGEGVAASASWLRGRRWGLVASACLVGAGPLSALVINFSGMNLRQDTAALDFGETVLTTAPEGAMLLSAQDAHTFTLWYFQHVLERRPDVVIVDTGLLGYDWYRVGLERVYPELVVLGLDADQLNQAHPVRPICEIIEGENHWLRCTEGE